MSKKSDVPVILGFLFPVFLMFFGALMIMSGFDSFFPFIFIIIGVMTGLVFSFTVLSKYGKDNKLW